MTAFLENKYAKWYFSITEHAKIRVLPSGYTESHHIIPLSLGGVNDKTNICRLTAKEHFICHLLLTKMVEGKAKAKCIYALAMMCRITPQQLRYTPTNSRTIASLRSQMAKVSSETHKGKTISLEQRAKQSKAMSGRTISVEHKQKIAKANLGTTRTEAQRQNISAAKRGKCSDRLRATSFKNFGSTKGASNGRARKITLRSPDGVLHEAHGDFAQVCESLGLTFSTMCNLLRGHKPTRGRCVGWEILESSDA